MYHSKEVILLWRESQSRQMPRGTWCPTPGTGNLKKCPTNAEGDGHCWNWLLRTFHGFWQIMDNFGKSRLITSSLSLIWREILYLLKYGHTEIDFNTSFTGNSENDNVKPYPCRRETHFRKQERLEKKYGCTGRILFHWTAIIWWEIFIRCLACLSP